VDHINTFVVEQPAAAPQTGGGQARHFFAPSTSTRLSWIVLGLIALLYVGVCFTPVIFDDNEGLYAGAVREMHQRGDWLVPMSNGFPRVQKPPLVYWAMLVSTSLLGENEFALRLPNALATVGWIVATYLIMRRLGGERFGLASALVLASMLGVWVFTHLVQPEPFLACFISFALWCLVEARLFAQPAGASLASPAPRLSKGGFVSARFPGEHWYLLFWLFLALGALSKGLHGALWPLGTALLTAMVAPGWRAWLRPILTPRGPLLFLVLLVPWYACMVARFPHFLSAHFINEQLGASLDTRYPADARQLPLGQFYAQHLLFWMPWTLLLPAAVAASLRARQVARRRPHAFLPQTVDLVKLLACWVALTLVSVAFSTRQDYYSMCCWGAVAAFLALPWMGQDFPFLRALPRSWLSVPCLLLAVAGAALLLSTLWLWPRLGALGDITASPLRDRDTFMDAIAGISPALWGKFIVLAGIFGAALLAAGAVASALAWRRRPWAALLVLSGMMAVPVGLAAVGFTMMSPYFSLAGEASAINREIAAQPDAVVACEALPHTASSLLYYLNARVHWVNAPFDQDYAQGVLGLGRDYYWDEPGLRSAWGSPHPVYFIIEQDRIDYWRPLLGPDARVVNQSGTRLVLCNRPD
jgi:4-amino-4-deoxy-L-arabinose transferase-like glycosyltransferase